MLDRLPGAFTALLISLSVGGLPSADSPAAEVPHSTLTVDIVWQTSAKPKLQARLTLRPLTGDREPLVAALPVEGPAVIALPPESRWEARVELPGFWVRGGEVEAGAAGSAVELRLPAWPWAKLEGRLKVSRPSETLPREVTVTTIAVVTAKRREEVPKGQIVCPVDAKGVFSCSLPASTYDLGIAAGGFIPFYRWGVRVQKSKPASLGVLQLAKGASVAGWVAVEEGAIAEGRCLARLRPATANGAPIRLRMKLAETRQEVRVRKDGFFQILGVTPGTYSLEVTQPEMARAFLPQLEVRQGLKTFVREPIVLRRPLKLQVHIDPPLDWLGQPWRVSVGRSQGPSAELILGTFFDGPAGTEGDVTVAGLAPGPLKISVNDSRDDRMYYAENLPLTGPADAYREVKIDYVTVKGTLRLGKEPLAGTLWFGGRFGDQRAKMESGKDGKFLGVLPHASWWQVTVDAEEPPLSAQTGLKIEPDRHGRAEVEVNLPATQVFGAVVDEENRPAPASDVTLEVDSHLIRLKADGRGKFETRGMPAGIARIVADRHSEGKQWTSSPVYLPLSEDQALGPIEIHLRRTRTFAGRVVAGGVPVPGANVAVFSQLPLAASSADRQATDIEGKFAVEVDSLATRVTAWAMAPGYGAQGFAADTAAYPIVALTRAKGTVVVQYPPGTARTRTVPYHPVVYQGDILFLALGEWLGMHRDSEAAFDDRLELPEMAPGSYQACGIPVEQLTAWAIGGRLPDPAFCAAGVLEAGGRLVLTPPAPGNAGASP